jgi:predicted CoA-binding protein
MIQKVSKPIVLSPTYHDHESCEHFANISFHIDMVKVARRQRRFYDFIIDVSMLEIIF